MTTPDRHHPSRKGSPPPDRPLPDPGGRDIPRDTEAERSINATLFAYPIRWFDVGGWLRAEDFYDVPQGLVYGAIGDVVAAEAEVDPITVRARLEQKGVWGQVGAQVLDDILRKGTINHPLLERLAGIVADKATRRRVIALGQRVVAEGYGEVEDDRAWSEDVPHRFEAAVRSDSTATGATAKETLVTLFETWEQTAEQDTSIRIGTGNKDLDAIFRKMRPAQLILVGAHSGVGKTAFGTGVAAHVALYERPEDKPAGVYIVSAEMTRDELLERMVFSAARVDSYKLDEDKRAFITNDEWNEITRAAKDLSLDHLYIDDRSEVTMAQIRAEAKRVQMRFARAGTPLRLIVIDYAQIVEGEAENKRRSDNREQEVAQVGRKAKRLAKELGVPVILLAQLNEDSVREKRKPRAGDLRESKALKHDSDKVVLIYNPNYTERAAAYRNGEEMKPLDAEHVDFIVDKNRGGRTGTVAATYYPSFTLFTPFSGTEGDLAALRTEAPSSSSGGGGGRKRR